ncbi:hypothetical protein OSB04_un000916 [Centaurea solstitialis]|uniref:Uncharacterized protein n=1 Tax=Centaurea solstitialis TaxID=347529 RepID=A0AA38SMP5_9ASTR|nr:hypothetical protein OSB04_un000916 [Centaurea solstitialis]
MNARKEEIYNSKVKYFVKQEKPYIWVPKGMVGLSVGEKQFIQGGIAQDLRTDGCKRLTYRHNFVETGDIAQAELGRSSSSAPEKGKVSIYIDCSPTAAPQFEV